MSRPISHRALRSITSFALFGTLLSGFFGSNAASAAAYGSASFRGDAMLIGSNMPAANSNDFTYEFHFKMNSLPSLAGVRTVGGGIWLFTTRPNRWNPGGVTLFVNTNGSLALDASDSAAKGITTITSASGTVAINNWYHVAITRSGNTFKVWVNGAQVSTGSALSTSNGFTGNYNSTSLGFGEYLPGNISNFRFTNGTALYSATFTPPTSQLTANGVDQVLIPFESDYTTVSSYSTIPTLSQPTGSAGSSAYFGGPGFQDATGNLNSGSYLTNDGITFSGINPFAKVTPTFTWANVSRNTGDSDFSITDPTPSTPGTYTYASATTSVISLSGSTATVVAPGSSVITATFTPTDTSNYNSATTTMTINVAGATQNSLVITAASGTFGSTTTLSTSGGSGTGEVTYTVVSGNCSISGSTLSNSSAGNCVLTATKAADASYNSITSAQATIVISKKSEIFSYSISSNTGSFKYGAVYTVSMTFPAGAVAGNGGWNVLKASTAWGINGAGDVVCNGASVSAAGSYLCSFNSAAMWPNAQAMAISGLHVRFNGSTNYNSFNQDSVGTKITIPSCDLVFCPSTESVTVTATNKTISYGTNLGGVGFETPYGDTGGQLRYTISNGANGASKAWGVSCTSTYTTGAGVGTYPITCSGTTRPTGAPTPVTNEWVIANTNYSALYDANADNFLYTLKNPRAFTSAANWWQRGSFYTSDTYQYLTYVQGTLTVNPLTLTAPTSITAVAVANSSTSIKARYAQSPYATSYTALLYASNGTTLLRTILNYESGTAITGLDPNTAYKVSIKALGDGSNSADSSPSSQASVTTNMNFNRTLSYDGGLGAVGTLPNIEVKLSNETITVGSNSGITKNGYSFTTWSNGVSAFSPGDTYTFGGADETLTAQWAINSYSVTFDANGGVGGTTASLNYNVDAIASAPTVTKNQYIFAGWAESTTTTSINSWTVVGSKTLYSLWTPKVYTITYMPESGTATASSETFTVGSSPISLQAATRSGYKFNGWFTSRTGGTLVGISGAQFTPTDTATVHAQWTQASLVGLSSPTSFGTIVATNGNDGGLSATRSGTQVEVDYFADSLPDGTVITAYLQGNTVYASTQLTGVANLLLSVVVAWKALDESVPVVDPTRNAIRLKITNPDIKRGARVYSIVGVTSTVLTTAAQDGFVEIDLREDPEIVIANPVVIPTPPAPAQSNTVDNSAALKAEKDKADAEASAAEALKLAQDKAAAELKSAREKAEAELKAAEDAAARLKAEQEARMAAELKAAEDAAIAAALAEQKIVPDVTLYSISTSLKLSTYDSSYLKKYVSTLKSKSTVTCIGYIYTKSASYALAKSRAIKQATAVCNLIKAQKKSLFTKIVLYSASKAPLAAKGAKWVAVSYRVDGFKS